MTHTSTHITSYKHINKQHLYHLSIPGLRALRQPKPAHMRIMCTPRGYGVNFPYRVYLGLLLIFDGAKRQNPRAAVRAVTMHRAPRFARHRVILIIDRGSL